MAKIKDSVEQQCPVNIMPQENSAPYEHSKMVCKQRSLVWGQRAQSWIVVDCDRTMRRGDI